MKISIEHINFLIKDEIEAIEGYNKAINFFKSKDNGITRTLISIKSQEIDHLSRLRQIKNYIKGGM